MPLNGIWPVTNTQPSASTAWLNGATGSGAPRPCGTWARSLRSSGTIRYPMKRILRAPPARARRARFEASFVRELPADPVLTNVPRQVAGASYTRVDPTPVAAPRLLGWSRRLGEYLGIDKPLGRRRCSPATACCPACSRTPRATAATSSAHWAGQLGDGRAITLGEIVATDGTRQELQLKGAGPTPYSRTADGRAVLRSSLREFVCSEAMHFLGVPTTRALSLVGTGEQVIRDMFYDGNPAPEPGAIVCRVAPSFLRFGNFQIHAANEEHDSLEAARGLRDPAALPRAFLRRVVPGSLPPHRAAAGRLDAPGLRARRDEHRQHVDPRPDDRLRPLRLARALRPAVDAEHHRRQTRRYPYGNQPQIAQWNLARLAEALLPLIEDKAPLEDGLRLYAETFNAAGSARSRTSSASPRSTSPATTSWCSDLFSAAVRGRDRLHAVLPQPGRAPQLRRRLSMPAFYAEPPPEHRNSASWLRRYAERAKGAARALERMNARQSEVRVPQLPCAARDRCARARRRVGAGTADEGARAALRRAAGAPTTSPRGAPSGRGTARAARRFPAAPEACTLVSP